MYVDVYRIHENFRQEKFSPVYAIDKFPQISCTVKILIHWICMCDHEHTHICIAHTYQELVSSTHYFLEGNLHGWRNKIWRNFCPYTKYEPLAKILLYKICIFVHSIVICSSLLPHPFATKKFLRVLTFVIELLQQKLNSCSLCWYV